MKKISLIISILFLLTSCGVEEVSTPTLSVPTQDSGESIQAESAPAI